MKKIISLLLLSISFISLYADDDEYQVDFLMMNQEIKSTVEENGRQKEMKSEENKNLVLEAGNKKYWESIKTTVKKIQDRLSMVDFALQGIPTGVVLARKTKEIKENQKKILNAIKTLPPNLSTVLNRQIKFVQELEMTSKFILGVVASYGIINQMEKAERKILLNYAMEEVDKLEFESYYTLFLIREAKMKMQLQISNIQYSINKDKEIIQDIIKEIKSY